MPPRISVVISTFERPQACQRALTSALAQAPAPHEVLICDDGSCDATPSICQQLEAQHESVRYLRVPTNTGTPGTTRNLGIAEATGEWVAFLDDDDQWLPDKLSRQIAFLGQGDVVGTNGLRTNGSPYFPVHWPIRTPGRTELVRDNPLIISSVIVRREYLQRTRGFVTPRWARGVADYAMWLELADLGARFVVLPEPCVLYESDGVDRMSSRVVDQEFAVARLLWARWSRNPGDGAALRAALSRSVAASRLLRSARRDLSIRPSKPRSGS